MLMTRRSQQQWRQQQLMRPATSSTMIHTNKHEQLLFYTFFLTGSSIDISHPSLHLLTCPFLNYIPCFNHRRRRTHGRLLRQPTIYGGEHRLASMVNRSEFWFAAKSILKDFSAVTWHFYLSSLYFILCGFVTISSSTLLNMICK